MNLLLNIFRRLTEGTVYGEINSTRRVSLEGKLNSIDIYKMNKKNSFFKFWKWETFVPTDKMAKIWINMNKNVNKF